ncbi:MAG: hypothetical protein PHO80_05505 [Candidatus Gracilibacteria bacterium]|nr:hypothetical protein [Candidatus Gracilibacteria bacterium]
MTGIKYSINCHYEEKNKYRNRSRISEVKTGEIVKYFSLDLTASKTTELT